MNEVTLYNGDCLEEMKHIPDHSVDMVLCDLPYGTTQNKWDSVIPLDRLWDEYKRVLRTGSAVVLFSQMPFTAVLYASNPEWFRYEWIWKKQRPTGFLNANRTPMKTHENILVFCEKGAPYNPQMTPDINNKPGKYHSPSDNYNKFNPHTNPADHPQSNGYRYPTDLLKFNTEQCLKHPTQKPVDLCEYLIKTYTDEGMAVLDNTMGSGSVGVAAVQSGRRFIGIELDEGYFATASERISKAEYKRKTTRTLMDFI